MERRFPITLLRVVLRMPKAIHLKDGRLLNRLFGPHGMKTETKLRTPAQGAIPSKGIRSVRTRFRGPIPSTWVVRMRAILAPTGQGGHSRQGNQWGGNPFANSSNPFKGTVFDFSSFFSNAPTAEELLQEAKADLRLDIELIAAKLVILALSFLLSAPATGLYLYTIISIGQGIWKRLNFLSLVLLVPFVMLALIFTPGGDATIGIIALILFACAVGFDISNVYRHVKMIRTLKRN